MTSEAYQDVEGAALYFDTAGNTEAVSDVGTAVVVVAEALLADCSAALGLEALAANSREHPEVLKRV